MSALRRFLYLTPYFPPQRRVGALRPLKFARHLPDHGWAPVVLCDLSLGDGVSPELLARVPESTVVIRDYSRRARPAEARFQAGDWPARAAPSAKPPGAVKSLLRRLQPHPEWLPLGQHSPDVPHALKAGRRALAAHRDIEAIVTNVDPYATMLVGRRLGLESGLPVIHDLRDPWSVCELRRPHRPPPQRWLVDRLERGCVEDAARMILNTETTLAAYRDHYADLDPARFTCIRNHGDATLIDAGEYAPRPVFTALFLGNFRRFIDGAVLFDAMARMRREGVGPDAFRLMVTGALSPESRARAAQYGVEDMLDDHPFVPYHEVGTFMATADLLVAVSNATTQRVPAKVYDYATTDRPMVVVADNPELGRMMKATGGVDMHGLTDAAGIAESFARAVAAGRHVSVDRSEAGLDSATATRALAAVLDAATA